MVNEGEELGAVQATWEMGREASQAKLTITMPKDFVQGEMELKSPRGMITLKLDKWGNSSKTFRMWTRKFLPVTFIGVEGV